MYNNLIQRDLFKRCLRIYSSDIERFIQNILRDNLIRKGLSIGSFLLFYAILRLEMQTFH